MKKHLLLNRKINHFSVAEQFLLYGLYFVICYATYLLLYEQISFFSPSALIRFTPVEKTIALEHLWVGLILLVSSFYIIRHVENNSSVKQ